MKISSTLKAVLLNFVTFALLFLPIRYALAYLLPWGNLLVALSAAVIASILSPKFASGRLDGKEKVVMKWLFFKGYKEI